MDHPLYKKSNKEKVTIQQLKETLYITFVRLCSYITKCYELADYVFDEKENVFKTVKKGNVKNFKDYVDEVLSKSKGCHIDLTTLIE